MIKSLYEPFRHWSDGRSVWLISDPHFDDPDCFLMDPDWPSPEQYIEGVNRKVSKADTLICLGDCGDPSYFAKIKARYKVLIKGNHDAGSANYEPYFDEIYDGPLIIGQKLILSHEPISVDWAVNIHGHCHRRMLWHHDNRYNICADVVGYAPFNLGVLIKSGILSDVESIHRLAIDGRLYG